MSRKSEAKLEKAQTKQNEKIAKYKHIHKEDEKYKNMLNTIKDVSAEIRVTAAASLNNNKNATKKRKLISELASMQKIILREYAELKASNAYPKAEKFYARKYKEHNKKVDEYNEQIKNEMAKQIKTKNTKSAKNNPGISPNQQANNSKKVDNKEDKTPIILGAAAQAAQDILNKAKGLV